MEFRNSLIMSGVLHLALLIAGIVAFPSVAPHQPPGIEAIPVDLVEMSEEPQAAGDKDAEMSDKPQKAVVKEAAPKAEPTPKEQPKKVEPTSSPPPPPPPPKLAAQPPKPAEKPPEKPADKPKPPKPTPAPPPKADKPEEPEEEIDPDGLLKKIEEEKKRDDQRKKDEAKKKEDQRKKQEEQDRREEEAEAKAEEKRLADAKAAADAKKAADAKAAADAKKAEDAKKAAEAAAAAKKAADAKKAKLAAQANAFDANNISNLLNRQQGASAPAGQKGDTPQKGSKGNPQGTGKRLTNTQLGMLMGMIRDQVSPCWSPPSSGTDTDNLVIKLEMDLNRDGSLNGRPRVVGGRSDPAYRVAADAAVRAVLRCSPLKGLPADLYDAPNGWKEVEFNFRPSEMQ